MKKQLLAISLLTMSPGLMAEYDDAGAQPNTYSQGQCGTCCKTPCCCKPCEPCCVPQPKKCIDCECYTPAYYDLQCDWGAFLSVDFLYWYARETNLAYAAQVKGTPVQNAFVLEDSGSTTLALGFNLVVPSSTEYLDTNWKPGFRIGLGWNSDCDGWDFYLNWTYMYNKRSDSTSVDQFFDLDTLPSYPTEVAPGTNQVALINPWLNGALVFPVADLTVEAPLLFTKVSGQWKLQYNQIDLEIGRKYWLSPCFTLRPYGALRGAWFKTTFNTNGSRDLFDLSATFPDLTTTSYGASADFTNRYWGVGLVGGLQPNWHFCSNFILYSNFDTGLIYGEFKTKKSESYTADVFKLSAGSPDEFISTWSNSTSSKFYQMTPVFDVAIGLRWEENWCCDRYKTALDIGWEHHSLLGVNNREKTTNISSIFAAESGISAGQINIVGNVEEESGDLGMGGLVIRLRVDF